MTLQEYNNLEYSEQLALPEEVKNDLKSQFDEQYRRHLIETGRIKDQREEAQQINNKKYRNYNGRI